MRRAHIGHGHVLLLPPPGHKILHNTQLVLAPHQASVDDPPFLVGLLKYAVRGRAAQAKPERLVGVGPELVFELLLRGPFEQVGAVEARG
jgi:hypothetical protein